MTQFGGRCCFVRLRFAPSTNLKSCTRYSQVHLFTCVAILGAVLLFLPVGTAYAQATPDAGITTPEATPSDAATPKGDVATTPPIINSQDMCKAANGKWNSSRAGVGCKVKGKREGLWISLPGGRDCWRRAYRAGKADGKAWGYYPDCKLMFEGAYRKNLRHGAWVFYFPTGIKAAEGAFDDDHRQGTWTEYHEEGARVRQGPFVDGKPHGLFTEWFTTGKRWQEVRFEKGKRQGDVARACREKRGKLLVDPKERTLGCKVERRKVGWWYGWHENAVLDWATQYQDDIKQGESWEYHPSGQLLTRGAYRNGTPMGLHIFHDVAGGEYGRSLIVEGAGSWTAYFHNGKKREQGRLSGGVPDGAWVEYYLGGGRFKELFYKKGRRHGPHRRYYKTGELMLDGLYADDNREGTWSAYYPGGKQVMWTGRYTRGLQTGYWVEFYYTGEKRRDGAYQSGLKNGDWTEYHENGKPRMVGPYRFGNREGTFSLYFTSGVKWREVSYRGGRLMDPVASGCKARGGHLVENFKERFLGCNVCQPAHTGETKVLKVGHWTWWHATGNRERSGEFRAGKRHGVWNTWYDDGSPMLRGRLERDKEQGTWRAWYRAGELKFTGSYQEGKQEGAWTTHHADGAAASSGLYRDGERQGAWTYRYPGGALKDRGAFEGGLHTGPWTGWHPGGKKRYTGAFAGGKRQGGWVYFKEDGKEWMKVTYDKGREVR